MALTTFACGTNLGSWAFGAISESFGFGTDVGCLSVVTQSRFRSGTDRRVMDDRGWQLRHGDRHRAPLSIVACALIVAQIRIATL